MNLSPSLKNLQNQLDELNFKINDLVEVRASKPRITGKIDNFCLVNGELSARLLCEEIIRIEPVKNLLEAIPF